MNFASMIKGEFIKNLQMLNDIYGQKVIYAVFKIWTPIHFITNSDVFFFPD